jgi:hypothetical protein
MLGDAIANRPPVVGTGDELERIRRHRDTLTEGYGLLKRRKPIED